MNNRFYTAGTVEGEQTLFEVIRGGYKGKWLAMHVDGSDAERCEIGPRMHAATHSELVRKMERRHRKVQK